MCHLAEAMCDFMQIILAKEDIVELCTRLKFVNQCLVPLKNNFTRGGTGSLRSAPYCLAKFVPDAENLWFKEECLELPQIRKYKFRLEPSIKSSIMKDQCKKQEKDHEINEN